MTNCSKVVKEGAGHSGRYHGRLGHVPAGLVGPGLHGTMYFWYVPLVWSRPVDDPKHCSCTMVCHMVSGGHMGCSKCIFVIFSATWCGICNCCFHIVSVVFRPLLPGW